MNSKEYADGLRRVADFYEQHPNVHIPYENNLTVLTYNTKEDALAVAATLGPCKKVFEGPCFFLIKEFGKVQLRFYFARDSVCKKVVVGHKTVPGFHIPEHTEEVIEWECHPLLSPEKEKVTPQPDNLPF